MECIVISSDEEEDVQFLTVKKANPAAEEATEKITPNILCNENDVKRVIFPSQETETKSIKPTIVAVKSSHEPVTKFPTKSQESVKKSIEPTVPVKPFQETIRKPINGAVTKEHIVQIISLVDDEDVNDMETNTIQNGIVLRPKNNIPSTKEDIRTNESNNLKNGNLIKETSSSNKKKSKNSDAKGKKQPTGRESDTSNAQEKISINNEPVVKKLIETCRKVEYGSEMEIVERKIWNYFNTASKTKTQSIEFKEFLESSILKIENILSSTKDKFMISRIIKEFINEMKNDELVVNGKLSLLYNVYEKLQKRITKLEETEVDSDEDGTNPYLYLARYRKKAVDVYNKICELEGRSTDADRPTRQRFYFNGSSAPIPVQRALERYYNKTHSFPDFYDVIKLVKQVNKEENLNLSENETHKIAQNVFLDFGERLVWRRKYDDYNILVDYLKENECIDPADLDTELQMKLAENKRTRKKEQEVLDRFATQDACRDEGKSENKTEGKTVSSGKLEEASTINLSSSSTSSLTSSPAPSDIETEGGDEDSDREVSEKTKQNNALFSDSDEELTLIEIGDKRKKLERNELPSKRFKNEKNPT